MAEYGEHHVYTRENYKMDIKAVLKKFLPNVLITTDWDDHMDHIALSLMIDECVGELLREMEYTPLILKAQAYTGRWEGNPDYYSGKNVTENVNGTFGTENVHPLNKWGDRIRFAVPKECNTRLLRQNILYRAACEYKSQGADVKAIQFINSDIIYWRKATESLSYHANITVSSGEGNYLNDFKCLDCTDIVTDYRNYDAGIWMPEETDAEKSFFITFGKPVYIQEICLYENPGKSAHIQNMSVEFEDGESVETGELESDGSCTRITLPQRKLTGSIKLKILSYQGVGAGLTEVEIYDIHKDISEYCLPLSIWSQKDEQAVPQRNTIGCRAEKLLFALIKKGRGRVWPNKWLLMQKYDDLHEHDMALWFWCRQIRFIVGRIVVKVRGRQHGAE